MSALLCARGDSEGRNCEFLGLPPHQGPWLGRPSQLGTLDTLRGRIEATGGGGFQAPGLRTISPDIGSQRFVRGSSDAALSEKKAPAGATLR